MYMYLLHVHVHVLTTTAWTNIKVVLYCYKDTCRQGHILMFRKNSTHVVLWEVQIEYVSSTHWGNDHETYLSVNCAELYVHFAETQLIRYVFYVLCGKINAGFKRLLSVAIPVVGSSENNSQFVLLHLCIIIILRCCSSWKSTLSNANFLS